LVENL